MPASKAQQKAVAKYVKNNYDILWKNAENTEAGMGIYNGDMGILRSIDPANETLTITDGTVPTYSAETVGDGSVSTQPSFTGSSTNISATFIGTAGTVAVS